MIKDLQSTALFTIIAEGHSLSDGYALLEWQEVDACIIGPSLDNAKTQDFLRRAVKIARSKDCAFVALVDRLTTTPEMHQPLLDAGAHYVIERPCSKMMMFDGIVRGVVAANEGSSWAQIFKQSGHCDLVLTNSASPANQKPKNKIPPKRSKELEQAVQAAIRMLSAPDLKNISDAIDSGEFRLDPLGQPTQKTKAAVKKFCSELLPQREVEPESVETKHFREFVEQSLLQWVVNEVNGERHAAVEELRKTLLSYIPPETEAPAPASAKNTAK